MRNTVFALSPEPRNDQFFSKFLQVILNTTFSVFCYNHFLYINNQNGFSGWQKQFWQKRPRTRVWIWTGTQGWKYQLIHAPLWLQFPLLHWFPTKGLGLHFKRRMLVNSGELSQHENLCYANFTYHYHISLLSVWTQKYLHSMTKLSGWIRHCL